MTPLVLAEPERPFWGFAELMLTAAIFLAALGSTIAIATGYFHAPAESGLWSVIEEAAAYAVLFLALKIMFARYGKGLLESLGWSGGWSKGWSKFGPFRPFSLAVIGVSLSVIVVVLQKVLLTPEIETPFERLLDDPASRIAVALFGITLGPVVEELLFRGLLQPVLVSTIGVFPGILLTSVLFGALHLTQNAFIWQIGLLITLVGFVLGTIFHLSGSTKASTVVHIAYNALPFIALAVDGSQFAKQ
jgi:membrane protease YdiL (CAAX protease family)